MMHPSDRRDDQPVMKASDVMAYRGLDKRTREFRATSAVLIYQKSALAHTLKRCRGGRVPGLFAEVSVLKKTSQRVAVAGNFGIGAPAVAVVLEELKVLGVRRCIAVGLAGALQANLLAGSVVVATQAVRDEGVSAHYLPPDQSASASKLLSSQLIEALNGRSVAHAAGEVWTTDAPYRELCSQVRQHQQNGVLAVEMEAAALFSVGETLGIEIACGLVIADSLADCTWQPPHDMAGINRSLHLLIDVAIEVLSA
jgi:purine-nucleoside phosphorylase